MDKSYEPSSFETRWYAHWERSGSFKPSGRGPAYSIVLPPPVTEFTMAKGRRSRNRIVVAWMVNNMLSAMNERRLGFGFCLGFEPPSYGVIREALRQARCGLGLTHSHAVLPWVARDAGTSEEPKRARTGTATSCDVADPEGSGFMASPLPGG